jgi:hypothetical protein
MGPKMLSPRANTLRSPADAEPAAGTRERGDPHCVLTRGRVEGVGQRGEHGEGEGVARLRAVRFEDEHASVRIEGRRGARCTGERHADLLLGATACKIDIDVDVMV